MTISPMMKNGSLYGGSLYGKNIRAELTAKQESCYGNTEIYENLQGQIGGVKFTANPVIGESGMYMLISDKNGKVKSHVSVDENGNIACCSTKNKDNKTVILYPLDVTV